MPAVVSLQPEWLQHEDDQEHENENESKNEQQQNQQQHQQVGFNPLHFSTSSPPSSAASPLSPFSSHSLSPTSSSHWLLLAASVVLVSSLLFVFVAALRFCVARVGRFRGEARPKTRDSFASSFSSSSTSSSRSLPPPLFQQKTASPDANINTFSEKDKTEKEPIINNTNSLDIFDAFDAFNGFNAPAFNHSAAPTLTSTLTSAPASASPFTHTSTRTPPFTPTPFPFTRPPTHAPAFPFPPLNTANQNYNFPKRLRRVRVYHLPSNAETDSNADMDDPRRTLSSSTTSTTVVSDDTTNGRPPPLPLSTSSFAFERPSLSEELSPSEDASSIAFIHQPNPDYGGGDDETVSPSSTSSSSSSSAETLTQTADISIADVVTGEILAADSNTAETPVDWGHHTQVYGGGVCLACLAAESSGGRGGEYGASVPMEDRR